LNYKNKKIMSAKYYKIQSTDGPNFIKVKGDDTYFFILAFSFSA